MQLFTYIFLKYVFRRFSDTNTVLLVFGRDHGKNCRALAASSHVLGRAVYWVFAFIFFFFSNSCGRSSRSGSGYSSDRGCDGNGRGTERYKSIALLEQTK